jgi:hypothetical protein
MVRRAAGNCYLTERVVLTALIDGGWCGRLDGVVKNSLRCAVQIAHRTSDVSRSRCRDKILPLHGRNGGFLADCRLLIGLSRAGPSRRVQCAEADSYKACAVRDRLDRRRAGRPDLSVRASLDRRMRKTLFQGDDDDGIFERSDCAASRAAAEGSNRSRPGIRDRARQSRRVPARPAHRDERRGGRLPAGLPGESQNLLVSTR